MNTEKIFDYSSEFLLEIIDHLIALKSQGLSKTKGNEFNSQLKILLGKSIDDEEFKNLTNLNHQDFKEKIITEFLKSRNSRIEKIGEKEANDIEKTVFLHCIDLNWKMHIQYLEQLRQVIGLRSYGQRDPLIEYKKEAFYLFESLLNKLKIDFVNILINFKATQETIQEKEIFESGVINPKNIKRKMSRNELCSCGSGKKYKKCCGAL